MTNGSCTESTLYGDHHTPANGDAMIRITGCWNLWKNIAKQDTAQRAQRFCDNYFDQTIHDGQLSRRVHLRAHARAVYDPDYSQPKTEYQAADGARGRHNAVYFRRRDPGRDTELLYDHTQLG